MEILQSDDKLREEIINDANVKAERIIKNADNDAKKTIENMKSQLTSFENELKKNTENDLQAMTNLINSSIDIEVSKNIIKYSGNFIDEVFNDIKYQIQNKFDYEKVILNLILTAADGISSDGYYMVLNENQFKIISKEKLLNLKLIKGKILQIEADNRLKNEILLYSSDKKTVTYISTDNFMKQLYGEERTAIYKILTE